MTTLKISVQSGRVTTEGDELYYEVRGQGQPLLMIPPGGGDGWQYARVADILAHEYKVITFDRRANGRSTMNVPQNFTISQQSRDAMAVLKAVGETSAFIFGNSSGAVIALDMAKTQPQAARVIIAHEPPLARLHPHAEKWQCFFAGVYLTAFRFGSSIGALRFMLGADLPVRKLIRATKPINLHRDQSSDPYIGSREAADFLVKQELLPVTNYLPDVQSIKENGIKVHIAIGEWAFNKKTWYSESAQILAQKLGDEPVIFPGHHGSFMDMPDEFAARIRSVLHQVETRG